MRNISWTSALSISQIMWIFKLISHSSVQNSAISFHGKMPIHNNISLKCDSTMPWLSISMQLVRQWSGARPVHVIAWIPKKWINMGGVSSFHCQHQHKIHMFILAFPVGNRSFTWPTISRAQLFIVAVGFLLAFVYLFNQSSYHCFMVQNRHAESSARNSKFNKQTD